MAVGACVLTYGKGIKIFRLAAFLGSVFIIFAGGIAAKDFDPVMILFVALTLVLFFLWIPSVGKKLSRGVFASLSFYVAVVLAFLLLGGGSGSQVDSYGLAMGAVTLALGIFTWASELREERLRFVKSPEGNGLRWVRAVACVCMMSAFISLLFMKPLPWLGSQAIEIGRVVRDSLPQLSDLGKRFRDDGIQSVAENGGQASRVSLDFGKRRELPRKGDIQLSGDTVMHLRVTDREQFRKFIGQQNYIRNGVLDKYVGDAWELLDTGGRWRSDAADGIEDGWVRLQEGEGILHDIYLPSAGGAGLPSIQNPLGYHLGFVIDSGSNMYEAELRGSVRYEAESLPMTWANARGTPQKTGQGVSEGLIAQAEGNLGRKIRLLFAKVTEGVSGPEDRLDSIQNYLRSNYVYTTQVNNPKGLPAMENFLFDEGAGWCDFFASSAALLAREAGYPARTAYGFSGGQAFINEQVISYQSSDAHSWAEILVEDRGLVVFDSTPVGNGAARIPKPSVGGTAPELSLYRDAQSDKTIGSKETAQFRRPSLLWLAVLLGVSGLFSLKLLVRSLLSDSEGKDVKVSRDPETYWDSDMPAYLREFLRMCVKFGRPKAKGDTVREAIEGIRKRTEFGSGAFELMAEYHYAVRYAGASRDPVTESGLRKSFRRLRKGKRS